MGELLQVTAHELLIIKVLLELEIVKDNRNSYTFEKELLNKVNNKLTMLQLKERD